MRILDDVPDSAPRPEPPDPEREAALDELAMLLYEAARKQIKRERAAQEAAARARDNSRSEQR